MEPEAHQVKCMGKSERKGDLVYAGCKRVILEYGESYWNKLAFGEATGYPWSPRPTRLNAWVKAKEKEV